MKIAWTGAALDDLERIRRYVTGGDGRAAAPIVKRVGAAALNLGSTPWIGRPGRVSGTRELVLVKDPYIVAYRVIADTVEVLRVLHTSRRWPKKMR